MQSHTQINSTRSVDEVYDDMKQIITELTTQKQNWFLLFSIKNVIHVCTKHRKVYLSLQKSIDISHHALHTLPHIHTYTPTHDLKTTPHPFPTPPRPHWSTHPHNHWLEYDQVHTQHSAHTPQVWSYTYQKKNTLTCIIHLNWCRQVSGWKALPHTRITLQFKAQASGSCTTEIQCHLLNQKGLPHIRPRREWGRERGRNTQIIDKQWTRFWHHLLQWLESSPPRDDYIVSWSDVPTCQ